jgi:hypothetical protein
MITDGGKSMPHQLFQLRADYRQPFFKAPGELLPPPIDISRDAPDGGYVGLRRLLDDTRFDSIEREVDRTPC